MIKNKIILQTVQELLGKNDISQEDLYETASLDLKEKDIDDISDLVFT
jgi:site-specific recombinase XerD